MADIEKRVFSVKREDFPGDLSSLAKSIFLFSARSEESVQSAEDFRFSEAIGFDFQNALNPVLEINCKKIAENAHKIAEKLEDIAEKFGGGGVNFPDEFSAIITLEDIGLGIRKKIYSIPLASLIDDSENKRININLKDEDLGFYLGFNLRCYLSKEESDSPGSGYLWSKSQIIADTLFEVKASASEALFEINYFQFPDYERKDLLFFVEWKSIDVSNLSPAECFEVKVNSDLKDQFKRLENNKSFGEFCIRLITDRILSNLVERTLRHARVNEEPAEESLHKKIRDVFSENSQDFDEYAKRIQGGDLEDQLKAISDVDRFLQRLGLVASNLEKIKFGGYRK
ncbi:MAG: hypothetical protein ISN28_11220 [Ectothiorhodospiraceae bacterium AqS1]|nr:hypothetical protein [Ectothiorhodospiraceae bacterium AqS1]